MSTGATVGLAKTVAAMSDDPERDRPIVGGPITILIFDETDWLADQSLADIDRVALPSDLAIVANASKLVVRSVVRLAQDPIEAPQRAGIVLGWSIVAERLVRALFVVNALEVTQTVELLSQAPRRRVGGVLQQREMQPLEAAVCCGWPGAMRSGTMPALITLTASRDSPPAPREANGDPLSERSRCGRPNSRNAASSTGHT
jgi:hypothetical protein